MEVNGVLRDIDDIPEYRLPLVTKISVKCNINTTFSDEKSHHYQQASMNMHQLGNEFWSSGSSVCVTSSVGDSGCNAVATATEMPGRSQSCSS